MLNMLIIVPEDLDISDPTWQAANPQVAWELSNMVYTYTPDKAPGTEYDAPNKVVHVIVNEAGDDPLTYYESLFIIYGLDWEIIGLQSFGNEIDAVWDNTDPENPVLVTPALPTVYKNVDTAKLFPFLQTRYIYDTSDPPQVIGEHTKELNWMHKFSGMAEWQ